MTRTWINALLSYYPYSSLFQTSYTFLHRFINSNRSCQYYGLCSAHLVRSITFTSHSQEIRQSRGSQVLIIAGNPRLWLGCYGGPTSFKSKLIISPIFFPFIHTTKRYSDVTSDLHTWLHPSRCIIIILAKFAV